MCLLTSVRAAHYAPPPTVPPLPWWAVDLSVVTSRDHRPRSAPAADTFWPMVGKEFLPVKVFGRSLLHQKVVSLMSNLGARCESSTWDHSTQYWFATSLRPGGEKCIKTDVVRRVLEDIFGVFVREISDFGCGFGLVA